MTTKTRESIISSVSAPTGRVVEDLRQVMAHAEDLLRETANQAGEGAAAARTRIQKSLQVIKGHLSDAEDAVIDQTKEAAKVTDEYVHENPWKAIGITAALGMIVGMLIARR